MAWLRISRFRISRIRKSAVSLLPTYVIEWSRVRYKSGLLIYSVESTFSFITLKIQNVPCTSACTCGVSKQALNRCQTDRFFLDGLFIATLCMVTKGRLSKLEIHIVDGTFGVHVLYTWFSRWPVVKWVLVFAIIYGIALMRMITFMI